MKRADSRTPFYLGGFSEVLLSSQTFTSLNQASVSFLDCAPLPFAYLVDFLDSHNLFSAPGNLKIAYMHH